MRRGQDFRAEARPPLRPAAFFWAVVPPWLALLRLEPEWDFLPPRLEAPGEFAIFAARSFDIPFSFSFSYCFSFLTLGRLPGIGGPLCCGLLADLLDRVADVLLARLASNVSLREDTHQAPALDHRQPAHLVLRHQLERFGDVAIGLDRDDVRRRDLAHGRRHRVLALGDDAERDV